MPPPLLPRSAYPRRRRVGLALLASLLAVLASLGGRPRADDGLALAVEPVALSSLDPTLTSAGRLLFRGGLWLRSSDPRFGGLSDLRVSPDGATLLAVSDCGYGLAARLVYDAQGRLVDLGDVRLHPLRAPGGRRLDRDEVDAESLARDGAGWLVGFEGPARLWRYSSPFPLEGAPEPRALPPGALLCDSNRGIEAAVTLADERLLLACEGPARRPASTPAWVGRGESWRRFTYRLHYDAEAPDDPFRPVAAALLPDGDVTVLERRFPPIAVRIVRLPRSALDVGGAVTPQEIGRLDPPLTVDNFEGLDARPGTDGETLLYLVSDDNDCAKTPLAARVGVQRTLLLTFALEGT